MSINLEARKLAIIKHLADIKDQAIIVQIENLLQPRPQDWWDELTEKQQKSIQLGVQQLNNNESVLYRDFISQYKNKK